VHLLVYLIIYRKKKFLLTSVPSKKKQFSPIDAKFLGEIAEYFNYIYISKNNFVVYLLLQDIFAVFK
jgi:hypothetical protein